MNKIRRNQSTVSTVQDLWNIRFSGQVVRLIRKKKTIISPAIIAIMTKNLSKTAYYITKIPAIAYCVAPGARTVATKKPKLFL